MSSMGTAVKGLGKAITRRRRRTFFLEFTAVFAVAAIVISLVAGLALGGYLTSGIRIDTATVQRSAFISIAASLAALYLVLVLLVRRGSNNIRRQANHIEGRGEQL